ncbi:MAG: plasma-membrane proton-efflux P-type ATPase [Betaproteobacteria bacterium]|nr:plasma-membrane proton-efflux P-type ATPase [Betaproteobacteria bacterium]
MIDSLTGDEAKSLSVTAAFERLESSPQGLSSAEAERRLAQNGLNALPEKKTNLLLKFLGYFWGPIPWMIEVAAILSAVVRHWADFVIILILLAFNAVVGFWQEFKAANALEALKSQLALKARVLRDGKWAEIDAARLVPGDLIRLRMGDIIPADGKLTDGEYLSVDQSALTGESLPVGKQAGDTVYSGSIAKQGEMAALVTATGVKTYFGETAKLVESAGAPSHFQKAVLAIGDYLIYMSLALVAVLLLVELYRGAPFLELVQFALILTVASIPVAMPAVLSVTMAVGALALSKMKAIVSRLQSIEEMAGIDILCSDKTGTLTQNKLVLGEPAVFEATDPQEVILVGALASKAENRDAIDLAVIQGLADEKATADFVQTRFMPFDPVGKRTEADIRDKEGRTFTVTKGAPQVILALAGVGETTAELANQMIEILAAKGYRTLGVARRPSGGHWQFLGILPLFDPPREDSRQTLSDAVEHGIQIKMVTGDNVAIARETATKLGLGANIQPATELFQGNDGPPPADAAERIEKADGFAQVFPEHKYAIVKALQARGHLVAMTGDGVNDAPALKQADAGIAVSGATDAARAAADLILTAPGLSTIVRAVEEARRIFERMNAYAIYRINETIRIMIFVVLAMIVYNFYPITAIMIILLAFFNDVPIMAIAYDNTALDPSPVRWDMHRVLAVSTSMGITGTIGSFMMLYLAVDWLKLPISEVQTFVFLKMAVSGHIALFIARARDWYVKKPYPAPIMIWAALSTKIAATLLCAYGFGLIAPISWLAIGLIWLYSIVWSFVTDAVKVSIHRRFQHQAPHHLKFIDTLGRHLLDGRIFHHQS